MDTGTQDTWAALGPRKSLLDQEGQELRKCPLAPSEVVSGQSCSQGPGPRGGAGKEVSGLAPFRLHSTCSPGPWLAWSLWRGGPHNSPRTGGLVAPSGPSLAAGLSRGKGVSDLARLPPTSQGQKEAPTLLLGEETPEHPY